VSQQTAGQPECEIVGLLKTEVLLLEKSAQSKNVENKPAYLSSSLLRLSMRSRPIQIGIRSNSALSRRCSSRMLGVRLGRLTHSVPMSPASFEIDTSRRVRLSGRSNSRFSWTSRRLPSSGFLNVKGQSREVVWSFDVASKPHGCFWMVSGSNQKQIWK